MPNCSTCLPLFLANQATIRKSQQAALDLQYVNILEATIESRDAVIEMLLESLTLYQCEIADTDYEMQQLETNLDFFEDAVERLKAIISEKKN